MAGEWLTLVSTAVGGVVGVAGTLGATVLTQRREDHAAVRSRRYAVEDARRQERKEVYLTFLDAVAEVERASEDAYDAATEGTPSKAADAAAFRATHTLISRFIEVELVASPEVIARAGPVVQSAADVSRAARTDRRYELVDGALTQQLLNAMAADLRLEPPPSS